MATPRKFLYGVLLVVLSGALTGCYYDVETELYPLSGSTCDTTGYGALTYQNGIKPIFDTNCATPGCHVANGAPGNFGTYAGIMPKVDDGSIRQRVLVERDMPPSGMANCDREKLRAWLDAGAPEN